MTDRQTRAVFVGISQGNMVEWGFRLSHVGGVASETIRKTHVYRMGNGLGLDLSGEGSAAARRSHGDYYQCKG